MFNSVEKRILFLKFYGLDMHLSICREFVEF